MVKSNKKDVEIILGDRESYSILEKIAILCGRWKILKLLEKIKLHSRGRPRKFAKPKSIVDQNGHSFEENFEVLREEDTNTVCKRIFADCEIFQRSVYYNRGEDIIARIGDVDYNFTSVVLKQYNDHREMLQMALIGISNRYLHVCKSTRRQYIMLLHDCNYPIEQYSRIIDYLVKKNVLDCESCLYSTFGKEKFTLAHFAVIYDSMSILQFIQKYAPGLIYMKGDNELTVLHIASLLGKWKMLKRICRPIEEKKEFISQKTAEGRTVFHLANIGRRGDPFMFTFMRPHLVHIGMKGVTDKNYTKLVRLCKNYLDSE